MADKSSAYGTKAADTEFRKKWDKEEYAERAKKKDAEERERMQENEERMKQGRLHWPTTDRLKPMHLAREGSTQRAQGRSPQTHGAHATPRRLVRTGQESK